PIDGYLDKFTAAALGGSPPDIVDIDVATAMSTVAAQGLLDDITDRFADLDADDYAPGNWQASHYKGRLYGIPDRADSEVYYYNKTCFDAAGVDYPTNDWTPAQFLDAVQRLTIPGDQFGFGIAADPNTTGNVWSTFLPMLWSMGGDVLNADHTKAVINSPESVAAITYWTDLYVKYHVTPDGTPNFNTARDLQPLFQANKLCLMTASSNLYDTFNKTEGLEWGTVLSPFKLNMAGGWSMAIPVGAPNPDAAEVFIKWFAEPDHLAKFMNRTPARVSSQAMAPWNDPGYDIFKLATPDSRAVPGVAGWRQMSIAVVNGLQKVLVGEASAQAAADTAAAEIDAIIAAS
ncbi:MAG: sugar ABC transporter substrate-binding protein, partial [Propionibacteriaceae bacterium]|nr:sugar ABC transporter substrate-binding protein [Propionibacteriaceae bacterium]